MHLSLNILGRLYVRHMTSYRGRELPSSTRCHLRKTKKWTTVGFGGAFREGKRKSSERILRYPNGDTRLIRYPAVDSETEPEMEPRDILQESFTEPVTPSFKIKDLPSSPMELVKLVNSKAFKKAQEEQRKQIRESYEILEMCPWETPLQLYIFAVEDPLLETSQIYTLRTRIAQQAATEKLKKMFRGENYEGDFIQVERMTDGVITFFEFDDAERFQSLLEAEEKQVKLWPISSQQLFQTTNQSKAVVVLMRCEKYLPSLQELSTSLRAQRSLEGN